GSTHASTSGDEVKLSVNGGYDFVIERFTVGPRLGINLRETTIDGFQERGNTGLELKYNNQNVTSLTHVVGVFASYALSTTRLVAGRAHHGADVGSASRVAPQYRSVPELALANGVRLHWREAGDPAKPPLVWIHGGSVEDSSSMVADLEPLAARVRALCPDTR